MFLQIGSGDYCSFNTAGVVLKVPVTAEFAGPREVSAGRNIGAGDFPKPREHVLTREVGGQIATIEKYISVRT